MERPAGHAPTGDADYSGYGLVMDDAEFERWVRLLEERTGVVVPPERKQFLETNLRLRMRELHYDRFAQYFGDKLEGRKGAMEWAVLVDRLTVHQTHFFRHRPSLDLVATTVLPEFISKMSNDAGFHAWSVGCSTGEEAYSLAMVLAEGAAESGGRFHYGVTASDVSQPALAVGKRGRYLRQKLSEVPEKYQEKYCRELNEREFEIDEEVLRRVGFVMLNLLEVKRQPMMNMNLIYCQNVLIYFPRDRRRRLLNELAYCLRPGGYLILGPGEVTAWEHPELQRISGHRTLAYRRKVEERIA